MTTNDLERVPCKRRNCMNHVYQLAATNQHRYSYERAGYCSSKCETIMHRAESRKRALNGGIDPTDPRTKLLLQSGFTLTEKGYGSTRTWVYRHNGVKLHFTYKSNGSPDYRHIHGVDVHAYLINEYNRVQHNSVGFFQYDINDADAKYAALQAAIALAIKQPPQADLNSQVENATAPRDVERNALQELAAQLQLKLDDYEHDLARFQKSFREHAQYSTHMKILQIEGARRSLWHEFDAVKERLENKTHPTQSPVAAYGYVPVEQLQLPGGGGWVSQGRYKLLTGNNEEGA